MYIGPSHTCTCSLLRSAPIIKTIIIQCVWYTNLLLTDGSILPGSLQTSLKVSHRVGMLTEPAHNQRHTQVYKSTVQSWSSMMSNSDGMLTTLTTAHCTYNHVTVHVYSAVPMAVWTGFRISRISYRWFMFWSPEQSTCIYGLPCTLQWTDTVYMYAHKDKSGLLLSS